MPCLHVAGYKLLVRDTRIWCKRGLIDRLIPEPLGRWGSGSSVSFLFAVCEMGINSGLRGASSSDLVKRLRSNCQSVNVNATILDLLCD